MIRFFDTQILRDGRTDGQGQAIETGLEYMLLQFDARYNKFDSETSTHAIIMLLQFRRYPGEAWDDAFSRFDNCRTRVNQWSADFRLPMPVLTWLLLKSLQVPRNMWPLMLAPTGGRLPANEDALRQLQDALRPQGHISELQHRGGPSNNTLAGHYAGDDCDYPYYPNNESFHGHSHHGSSDEIIPGAGVHTDCVDDDGWPHCASCNAYYGEDDDGNSTDTDYDPELASSMTREEL